MHVLKGFLIILLWSISIHASNEDWYSFYLQCVATSSQEVTCYDAIRDFLATEEGRKQAQELGFKRKLYRDHSNLVSHSIAISQRVNQMHSYLLEVVNSTQQEKDTLRSYCLSEKIEQMVHIKNSVDEIAGHLTQGTSATWVKENDTKYEMLLALNSRANQVYQQARKCF